MICKNRDLDISIIIDFVILRDRYLNICRFIYINSSLLIIIVLFSYIILFRLFKFHYNYNANILYFRYRN